MVGIYTWEQWQERFISALASANMAQPEMSLYRHLWLEGADPILLAETEIELHETPDEE